MVGALSSEAILSCRSMPQVVRSLRGALGQPHAPMPLMYSPGKLLFDPIDSLKSNRSWGSLKSDIKRLPRSLRFGGTPLYAPILPAVTTLIYFASGAHRTRGAYVRINRRTQKLYYVFPRSKQLHVIDWAHVEALAGYIPIFSGTINTSRHPLYLLGVDSAMTPPTEICVACGNLGVAVGDFCSIQRTVRSVPQGGRQVVRLRRTGHSRRLRQP